MINEYLFSNAKVDRTLIQVHIFVETRISSDNLNLHEVLIEVMPSILSRTPG
jgi:hypothetical protein